MADLLAPIITLAVIAVFAAPWIVYRRRVRQGRADPIVDPSLPSNLQPMPRQLHDPADVDAPHSLYFDPKDMDLKRRDDEPG
jgi:hypothetical protein